MVVIEKENYKMTREIAVKKKKKWFLREYPLHLMLIPGILVTFVYSYLPLFGLVMAFQNFNPIKSFGGSEFVGFENFRYVFSLVNFGEVFWNTVQIAVCKLLFGLTFPLLLALLVNEVQKKWFCRITQTIYFLPFFLSWVILGGVFKEVLSLQGGVNTLLDTLFGVKIHFLASNKWFPVFLVTTDVWKGMGYNMVIYLAAITNVDTSLYEAAALDGCGRIRQLWHVTLPGMRPIIILLATLSLGSVLNAGFDQIFNMYNPLVYESADVLDTLVYRIGLINRQYSVSAALGLFKSIVSTGLVGISYYLAYKLSDYRIF